MREVLSTLSGKQPGASRILVMEGDAPADPHKAVLTGVQ
jgi:hypothetical protein